MKSPSASILTALGAVLYCHGQSTGIRLHGTVEAEASGRPIKLAQVSAATGARSSVTTDDEGVFTLPLTETIRPGDVIRLHVQKGGYEPYDRQQVASNDAVITVRLKALPVLPKVPVSKAPISSSLDRKEGPGLRQGAPVRPPSPLITSVEPHSVRSEEPTQFTILGSGFRQDTQIVAGIRGQNIVVSPQSVSGTQVRASITFPSDSGPVSIFVRSGGAESNRYGMVVLPAIQSFLPLLTASNILLFNIIGQNNLDERSAVLFNAGSSPLDWMATSDSNAIIISPTFSKPLGPGEFQTIRVGTTGSVALLTGESFSANIYFRFAGSPTPVSIPVLIRQLRDVRIPVLAAQSGIIIGPNVPDQPIQLRNNAPTSVPFSIAKPEWLDVTYPGYPEPPKIMPHGSIDLHVTTNASSRINVGDRGNITIMLPDYFGAGKPHILNIEVLVAGVLQSESSSSHSFDVDAPTMQFTISHDNPQAVLRAITVTSRSSRALQIVAKAKKGSAWLLVSPGLVTLSSGQSAVFQLKIEPKSIPIGQIGTESIVVTGGEQNIEIPVVVVRDGRQPPQ